MDEILETVDNDRVIIYKDELGEWRWKRVAGNNEIIACSGEGYKSLNHCLKMVRRCNSYIDLDIQE